MEGLLLHKLDCKREIFSSDLLVDDETIPVLEMKLVPRRLFIPALQ
jgi:hypothetical protein